jgi:hypothetical protein
MRNCTNIGPIINRKQVSSKEAYIEKTLSINISIYRGASATSISILR